MTAIATGDLDHEILAILEQAERTRAIGNLGGIEQYKALHGCLMILWVCKGLNDTAALKPP
ncbi:hypothetical protein [Pseudomonas sp. CC6-YY-74]|uniref:hypothetical protein n=1 Tax=Pseudomonas sp. CC6-YY-74 TaxID=1930532 RepID=UPI0021154D3B|nr:hypothetical protein [Pseudomonas sp. CC6-YY-74]